MTLTLQVPESYDLLSSIHAWIYPDIQPVPEMTWKAGFGRLFTFDETRAPVLVTQEAPGYRLQVQYHSVEVSAPEVRRKIKRVLGFNIDTKNALKHIADDSVIHPIEPTVRGIHPYCTDTVFEALVKSIIQQEVSYRAANTLTKRMICDLGLTSALGTRLLYSFPAPAAIVNAGTRKLSEYGLGFKAGYAYGVCSAIDSGSLDVEHLWGKTADDARGLLTSLRGIGDWTVDALAISGLGDFSVYPSGDLGMRNLLGRLYNNGVPMKESQVVQKADSWGKEGPMVLYLLMCASVLGAIGPAGSPKTHKREPLKTQPES